MAFDEVTLFEFDLEGAQFGPKEVDVPERFSGRTETEPEEATTDVEAETDAEDESGGPSLGRMVLMAIVVSVVATLVARRLRGGDDEAETTQIEFDEDEEAPEIGA